MASWSEGRCEARPTTFPLAHKWVGVFRAIIAVIEVVQRRHR